MNLAIRDDLYFPDAAVFGNYREAWRKWLLFCIYNLQIHFVDRKPYIYILISENEVCLWIYNWQYTSIALGNSLTLKSPQAIANVHPVTTLWIMQNIPRNMQMVNLPSFVVVYTEFNITFYEIAVPFIKLFPSTSFLLPRAVRPLEVLSLTMSFRVAILVLGHLYNCPSASEVTWRIRINMKHVSHSLSTFWIDIIDGHNNLTKKNLGPPLLWIMRYFTSIVYLWRSHE